MLSLDELIGQAPLIHNERTRTWAIHPDLARFLDDSVDEETTAVETGSGLSTLVILRKAPRLHVAVQPNADEFAVIVDFAEGHDIDTRAFRPVVARSQNYLPTAELPPLDLVLIDGDHSFPTPFVDWFYTADRLKVGGFMIVDDTHVGTGAILAAFMDVDPRWDQVLVQPERFAIYRKRRGPVHLGDWVAQPFLRDAFPTVAARLISVSDAAAERALIEELQATRTLLEVVRGERDQAIAMARDTAERLRTVESTAEQLRAVERALVEQLEHMRTLVDVVRGERDQAIATVRDAVERIRAMESTKFWKARRVWFRLRRLLRLPGHE